MKIPGQGHKLRGSLFLALREHTGLHSKRALIEFKRVISEKRKHTQPAVCANANVAGLAGDSVAGSNPTAKPGSKAWRRADE